MSGDELLDLMLSELNGGDGSWRRGLVRIEAIWMVPPQSNTSALSAFDHRAWSAHHRQRQQRLQVFNPQCEHVPMQANGRPALLKLVHFFIHLIFLLFSSSSFASRSNVLIKSILDFRNPPQGDHHFSIDLYHCNDEFITLPATVIGSVSCNASIWVDAPSSAFCFYERNQLIDRQFSQQVPRFTGASSVRICPSATFFCHFMLLNNNTHSPDSNALYVRTAQRVGFRACFVAQSSAQSVGAARTTATQR